MFYFVSIKLRNTEEKLFLTGPQHFSSQFCTRIFVLGLCEYLVHYTNDIIIPTCSVWGGIKPGFPVVCMGRDQTHLLHTLLIRRKIYAKAEVIAKGFSFVSRETS